MSAAAIRFLDPIERSLEVLFGLIMVLGFTASIDIAQSGTEDVHDVLVGALGCNLAWGVVDAVMYLIVTFAGRARETTMLKAIRTSREPHTAHHLLAAVLPPGLAGMLTSPELEVMRRRLAATSDTPRGGLGYEDYLSAAGVFLLVFLSTLPVIAPFLVISDVRPALRLSHGIGIVMLFAIGWSLGVHAGRPGWRAGIVMTAIGAALTGLTFVLGG